MARQIPLPTLPDDNPQVSALYRNFAQVAGTEESDNLNFLFQIRKDGDANNVYIQKVAGYAALGDDKGSRASLGGGHYYKADGTKKQFIVYDGASNSDIYELVSTTWTAASRSLTAVTEGYFAQFKDNLYYTNGVDAFQKYDGSSWSSLATGTPYSGASNIAKFALEYNNMLISAKSVNNPNRLWISDSDAPETVGASSYFDFPEGDITGVAKLGSLLVVTTASSVNVLNGFSPTTMTRRRPIVQHGCLSHRSMKEVAIPGGGKELWFVSSDNCVRAFNGETSRRVAYDYLYKSWPNVNKGQINLCAATVYLGVYYLAVPYNSSTYNNKVFVCDPRFEVWIRLDNWQPKFLDVFNSSGNETLWFGEASGDSVAWQYPSGFTTQKTAASTPISLRFTSCNLDNGEPYLIKKFKKVYFQIKTIGSAQLLVERNIDETGWSGLQFGSSGQTYVDLSTDGTNWGSGIWGSFTFGASSYVVSPKNRGIVTGKGKIIKYRISDSQMVGQSEIYNMQHFFIPKKVK